MVSAVIVFLALSFSVGPASCRHAEAWAAQDSDNIIEVTDQDLVCVAYVKL